LTSRILFEQEFVADEYASRVVSASEVARALVVAVLCGLRFSQSEGSLFDVIVCSGSDPNDVRRVLLHIWQASEGSLSDESTALTVMMRPRKQYDSHPSVAERIAALKHASGIECFVTTPRSGANGETGTDHFDEELRAVFKAAIAAIKRPLNGVTFAKVST